MPRLDGRELAAIYTGGCIGALGRAGLAEAAAPAPGQWPWPTFAVNIAGALLLGYLVTRLQERLPLSAYRRPLLGTGLCGALTTFSTWMFEHVRPSIGTRPLKQLAPLEVQAIYDRLVVGGRREGKPGGLAPWLGTWTVLAAATGARNGELCGLEWSDLDLDAGTVRFRQALINVDPAVLPGDPGSRRMELAVGPVKSTAGSAILTLPPSAIQAMRAHRRQQTRLRLALGQPPTLGLRWVEPGRPPRPVELDLVFRTERGTPVNPNHATRTFARLAATVGLAAHPTCCATPSPRRWRPTRNRPASSPPSSVTPTVAPSPNGSTSTSFPRPPPGWPN